MKEFESLEWFFISGKGHVARVLIEDDNDIPAIAEDVIIDDFEYTVISVEQTLIATGRKPNVGIRIRGLRLFYVVGLEYLTSDDEIMVCSSIKKQTAFLTADSQTYRINISSNEEETGRFTIRGRRNREQDCMFRPVDNTCDDIRNITPKEIDSLFELPPEGLPPGDYPYPEDMAHCGGMTSLSTVCEKCGEDGAHVCIPEVVKTLKDDEGFKQMVKGLISG